MVARQHSDVVLAQLARQVGKQLMTVLQFNAKGRVGKALPDHTIQFEILVLAHAGPRTAVI